MAHSWAQCALAASLIAFAASAYVYFVCRPLPTGLPRLAAAGPVFIVYAFTPWLFSMETQIIGIAVLYCALTWVASFRLLTFCWGRGPAADPWIGQNLLRFHAALAVPVNIGPAAAAAKNPAQKGNGSDGEKRAAAHRYSSTPWEDASSSWQLAARCAAKAVGVVLLTELYDLELFHSRVWTTLLYTAQLYMFATLVCESMTALAQAFLGMQLKSPFNEPYKACTLEDFWAHRWNSTVSTCLRETIYEPCLFLLVHSSSSQPGVNLDVPQTSPAHSSEDHRTGGMGQDRKADWPSRRPPAWAQLVAIIVTFAISGVMHELAIYYISLRYTGEMTAFFTLHGFAMVGEKVAKRFLRGRSVPRPLAVFLTLGFTYLTAHRLFFGPIMDLGLDRESIAEIRSLAGI